MSISSSAMSLVTARRARLSLRRLKASLLLGAFVFSSPTGSIAAGAEQRAAPEAAAAKEAKAEFATGNSNYEAGDYRGAAEAFERANALAPHAAVLFNAAKSWGKLGELERAADDYAASVQRGELAPDQTAQARGALARLRKKLGWIVVAGASEARVSVGVQKDAALPLTTHLVPGEHVIDVTHGGETWQQMVTIQADSPLSVVIQASADRGRETGKPERALDSNANRGRNAQKVWGAVALGTGGALGIGAAITGSMTLGALRDFEASGLTSETDHDRAQSMKMATNILAFSGAALGITGVTLLLTLPKKKYGEEAAGSAGVTVGPGRIAFSGTF